MERVEGIGGFFFRAAVYDEGYPNGRVAQLHDPQGNAGQLWQPA